MTGALVRWVAGIALLAYAGYAYTNHTSFLGGHLGGGLGPIIPALLGVYLIIRGFTAIGGSR